MKRIFFLFCVVACLTNSVFAQTGEIVGTIVDEAHERVINASVFAIADGIQRGSVVTDFDGNFSIKQLPVFSEFDGGRLRYTVHVDYPGYQIESVDTVMLDSGKREEVNVTLKRRSSKVPHTATSKLVQTVWLDGCRMIRYTKPLIEPKMPCSRTLIEARDLERMPY